NEPSLLPGERKAHLLEHERGGRRTAMVTWPGPNNGYAMTAPLCRFCSTPLQDTFVDLGMSPLCESYVPGDKLNQMEPFYPLKTWGVPLLLFGPLGALWDRREDIWRIRVFFLVRQLLGQARGGLCRSDRRAIESGRAELCRRAGEQRRVSVAMVCPPGHSLP